MADDVRHYYVGNNVELCASSIISENYPLVESMANLFLRQVQTKHFLDNFYSCQICMTQSVARKVAISMLFSIDLTCAWLESLEWKYLNSIFICIIGNKYSFVSCILLAG